MKAATVERMLCTGEVYPNRSVLLLPMSRELFKAAVAPRRLERNVWAIKSAEWSRGFLELLVKVFPDEPGQDFSTARSIARELRAIRRAGVSVTGLRIKPYRHREKKGAGLHRDTRP